MTQSQCSALPSGNRQKAIYNNQIPRLIVPVGDGLLDITTGIISVRMHPEERSKDGTNITYLPVEDIGVRDQSL